MSAEAGQADSAADLEQNRHSGSGGITPARTPGHQPAPVEQDNVSFTDVALGHSVAETGDPIQDRKHRENMQKVIVYAVVGLLLFTVVAIIIRWLITPNVDVTKYTSTILAPVLGISGTVIGFYFSGKDDN